MLEDKWAVYNKRTGKQMSPTFNSAYEAQLARNKYNNRLMYWTNPNADIVPTVVRRVEPLGRWYSRGWRDGVPHVKA